MRALLLALAAAAVAATVGLACGQDEEEVAQPAVTSTPAASPSSLTPTSAPAITPGPGVTLYRWVNVTVLIPNGSGISGSPGAVDYPGKPLHFLVGKVDPDDSRIASTVVLDSENGAIVEEQVLDQHRTEIDAVLTTLRVSVFDRKTAPWPYNGELTPDLVRKNEGGISWIQPSPSTGLYVGWGLADPGGFFVDLRSERSTAFASFDDAAGNLALDTSAVVAEDLPAFERWLTAVKRCGTEIECWF